MLPILALVLVSCQAVHFTAWVDIKDVEEWCALPPNVCCDHKVLDALIQHFAMSLMQSAVLDGYWQERFQPILPLMPLIPNTQAHSFFDALHPQYSTSALLLHVELRLKF